ncbi:hypothetical protein Tdes44962_MAKER07544 [Teratosphaeria destructans]|uniref:Uncharacterized protein n=1 Tax=Teratosphaeria destructans TaxID=418781 RepID=A0A9W7SYY9_9PEZI|nr:hypothetical protein Tdes44962_MAKER07544 [Teratosphaeria destructans]
MAFLLRPLLATTLLTLPPSSIAQSNPPTYTCPSQAAGTCSLRFTLTVFESIELEYSCGKLPTALHIPPANPLPAIHDHTAPRSPSQPASATPVSRSTVRSPGPWTSWPVRTMGRRRLTATGQGRCGSSFGMQAVCMGR